jgi:hypothetical protein
MLRHAAGVAPPYAAPLLLRASLYISTAMMIMLRVLPDKAALSVA